VNVVAATDSYESWLGTELSVVLSDDLAVKHERMAESAFPFLRATYYLWLARLGKRSAQGLTDAPKVVAIGDLHVENFGCWRDADGRLAWGVNDLDEIAALPYTYDLLRLSASALLAVRERRLPLAEHEVTALVLEGYRDGLASGGKPFVAGAGHRWLALPSGAARDFWPRLERLPAPAGPALPDDAEAALHALAPAGAWHPTLHRRTAGLGSLGHRRVVAVGKADGGLAAREVKELSPPAGVWLGLPHVEAPRPTSGPSWTIDPLLVVRGPWQCRRLAPDCVKLELADYGHGEERHLLKAMGFEAANVHQRSQPGQVAAVRTHAKTLPDAEFRDLVERLTADVEQDRHDWHAHFRR
jgi:Uncharacterized protein conserved in bacteria (DUF2252)